MLGDRYDINSRDGSRTHLYRVHTWAKTRFPTDPAESHSVHPQIPCVTSVKRLDTLLQCSFRLRVLNRQAPRDARSENRTRNNQLFTIFWLSIPVKFPSW